MTEAWNLEIQPLTPRLFYRKEPGEVPEKLYPLPPWAVYSNSFEGNDDWPPTTCVEEVQLYRDVLSFLLDAPASIAGSITTPSQPKKWEIKDPIVVAMRRRLPQFDPSKDIAVLPEGGQSAVQEVGNAISNHLQKVRPSTWHARLTKWYAKGIHEHDDLDGYLDFWRILEIVSERRYHDGLKGMESRFRQDFTLEAPWNRIEKLLNAFMDQGVNRYVSMMRAQGQQVDQDQLKKLYKTRNMIAHGEINPIDEAQRARIRQDLSELTVLGRSVVARVVERDLDVRPVSEEAHIMLDGLRQRLRGYHMAWIFETGPVIERSHGTDSQGVAGRV